MVAAPRLKGLDRIFAHALQIEWSLDLVDERPLDQPSPAWPMMLLDDPFLADPRVPWWPNHPRTVVM